MTFWQLTVDAYDPARLAAFWAHALGYQATPAVLDPEPTWQAHYRRRMGDRAAYDDRIFDPEGHRPPIWFQGVPEEKAGKNRLHLDLYPTGRDDTLTFEERVATVGRVVADLEARGAHVVGGHSHDDPADPEHFVTMQDPEGNEFCVS